MRFAWACVVLGVLAYGQHTQVFFDKWYSVGNSKNTFFDPDTFGMDIADPCRRFEYTGTFRALVNREVGCSGAWCIGGQFACRKHGDGNCYHVEHIVDVNGGEFSSSDLRVGANLVMAWGRWNSGLGGLARGNYPAAVAEKAMVYGSGTVATVRSLIRQCARARTLNTTGYDQLCDAETCDCNSDSPCGCDCDFELYFSEPFVPVYVVIILSIFACLTVGALCGAWYVRWRAKKVAAPREHSQELIVQGLDSVATGPLA